MQFKKILSILLAIALIYSVFTIPGMAETETSDIFEVGVAAETTTPISTSPVIYNQGDDVAVKISADQNTGFNYLKFKVSFDDEVLEYVGYTSHKLFNNEAIKANADHILLTFILNNVSKATGDIVTLNFKIKDSFCGETSIDTEIFQNRPANCKNGSKNVPFVGGTTSFTTHNVNTEEGVVTAPTCTEEGYTTYTCSACDEKIESNFVDSLGHTAGEAVEENRTEATCTEDGTYDSVVYCTVCDAELSRETIAIETLGHTLTHYAEKIPTCTEKGWYAYDKCEVCDYTTYSEIAPLEHSVAVKEENYVDATCTTDGSYDIVAYCDVCKVEFSRKTITTESLDHTYSNECDRDCNVCGEPRKAPHKYDNVCDNTCDLCGTERETSGHIYSNSCDIDCNICGDFRAVQHTFTNECDTECNICYDTRIAPHKYDGACDAECNLCGKTRTATEHKYGDDLVCDECGHKNFVLGDIDNNGYVDLNDVNTIARYFAGWNIEVNKSALDVDGDGLVNLNDLIHLAQYVADWDVTLN